MLRMCAETRMRLHAPNVSDFFFTDFDKKKRNETTSPCKTSRNTTFTKILWEFCTVVACIHDRRHEKVTTSTP